MGLERLLVLLYLLFISFIFWGEGLVANLIRIFGRRCFLEALQVTQVEAIQIHV